MPIMLLVTKRNITKITRTEKAVVTVFLVLSGREGSFTIFLHKITTRIKNESMTAEMRMEGMKPGKNQFPVEERK
ncbi:hypothetical protein B6U90_04080 [Thermoplasmatales archaeon ex4484_6]|nr:MAG: hypothetical protein B6U90_04080 [Thermoplasmatales archaeon ex4484_6]RLF69176.1 MAG: hypothetical protein DRN57_01520 [Thermoplasmata archaeon]